MWASEGVLALALAKTSPPPPPPSVLSTHRQVRCYWPRRHVRDHTGHTTRWSIDWGDRFSSEEYRDEGEEERVEGAGEESIGSLEDTGHWLSSSRKSDSSEPDRSLHISSFSWNILFFNSIKTNMYRTWNFKLIFNNINDWHFNNFNIDWYFQNTF